jgi:hypothetical protein
LQFPSLTLRPLALSLALVSVSALCAGSALASGSSAFGLSANFTIGGINTAIEPVNPLNNGVAAAYNKTRNSGAYNKALTLDTGTAPPVLTVAASNLRSHISHLFGLGSSFVVAEATASGLNLNLAPAKGTSDVVVAPYLQITAESVQQTGNYNHTTPNRTTVASEGAIKNLVVTGTLVGGKTLKFSGVPKPDQILFQSPTVTITLGQSISAELISCGPKCVTTPYFINTSGLQVTLTNAVIGKRKVSGQITVDAGHAGLEGGL